MDPWEQIKQAVRSRRIRFTRKARLEMRNEGMGEEDVRHSILNASGIWKSMYSTSPRRKTEDEKLHVIVSEDQSGRRIYIKGKLVKEETGECFYHLISWKPWQRGSRP